MHGHGKSDTNIVATNRANKPTMETAGAESGERRTVPKGNTREEARLRTLRRDRLIDALARVRQAAESDKTKRLNALWHHVSDVDRLREAFYQMPRHKATGIDQQTWQQYEAHLEEHLHDLADRLQRGAYRAMPVRRVYIPKPDGRKRPLGIPTLEDKLVQRVTAEVLQAIYEADFHDFSYGFRPKRSPHHALDALTVTLEQEKISWVLDVDIRAFFETIDHEGLITFLEHRIADPRVIRHVNKWLKAGVLEDGVVQDQAYGTPQGGSISPLLANVYLHYALDNWAARWKQTQARGAMTIIRFADDLVGCFQYQDDAERFHQELRTRLARFHLELHPDKTRLVEFGRVAASNRQRRGAGKPETFTFLGFTHICSQTQKGNRFAVLRKSSSKKVRAKLKEIKAELRARQSHAITITGRWLSQVLRGHYRYYAVPRNLPALYAVRDAVTWVWKQVLCRRSQRGHVTWERMHRIAQRWLPRPRVLHPYPNQRLTVTT